MTRLRRISKSNLTNDHRRLRMNLETFGPAPTIAKGLTKNRKGSGMGSSK
jgi:hypothetical protein